MKPTHYFNRLRGGIAAAGIAAAMLLAPLVQAAPFTFTFSTLPGGGVLTGNAGQLVGWGYSLTNTDTANWFVPTELSASSIALGTMDGAYFDFPVLAPGATQSAAFDAALLAGLYGIEIDATAALGQSESGLFTLAGEWWSGDPLAGGIFLQAGEAVVTPFTVQVGATAVPLPGTAALFAIGMLGLLAARRRAQLR